MKTSEVFKALEKNPNLKFVCKNGNKEYFLYTEKVFSTFYGLQCRLNGEIIGSKAEAANFFGNIKIDADWQLVRTPVPWQEALQAWAEGKTVRCELNHGQGIYTFNDFHAKSCEITPLSRDMVRVGIWYIEGDANG